MGVTCPQTICSRVQAENRGHGIPLRRAGRPASGDDGQDAPLVQCRTCDQIAHADAMFLAKLRTVLPLSMILLSKLAPEYSKPAGQPTHMTRSAAHV